MCIDALPYVLQTSDPLFPTGSYAHSFGLEEFVRLTDAREEAALGQFLELHILPALTCKELPYLRYGHDAAIMNDFEGLIEIDREIHAWKVPSELRAASCGWAPAGWTFSARSRLVRSCRGFPQASPPARRMDIILSSRASSTPEFRSRLRS